MKTKDYIEKILWCDHIALILTKAAKNEFAPGYHPEYEQYQTYSARSWLCFCKSSDKLCDSIVLNDRQAPVDWLYGDMSSRGEDFAKGNLKCLLVVGAEDFKLLCPDEKERENIERSIEERLCA